MTRPPVPASASLRGEPPSFLRTSRGRLEYSWIGPAPDEAPTLVFLHEGLGSVSLWRDVPAQLAAATGCGALVYSRAGYGRSDPWPVPWPVSFMHQEAEVLGEVLRAAQVDEAILVGHSDGASIAIIHTGGSPGANIRALVLEAPHVFVEPMCVDSIAQAAAQYRETDLRHRLERHHGSNVDVAFWGWNRVWLDQDFLAWNIEEYLPGIRVPTLVVQGDRDEYGTWKQVESVERQVSAPVETHLIPDCGHSPHRDQPGIVLPVIARFVGRVLADAGARAGA